MAIEPRMPARNTMIINFPEQILSVDASSVGGGTITQSGSFFPTTANDGQSYIFNCTLSAGYRISNIEYNSDSATLSGYTDNSFTIIGGMGGVDGTATISVAQIGPKAISLDNLQTFKEKCDETYAEKTDIPEEYTLPVANASTLGGVKPVAKTSEMTQNVGVDSDGALYTKPAPDIEPISEQVSDLSQSVDDIYTILQQEVYNAQDIEQEYSSRETADGADIIDGALETVKKIQGATVKTTNLIPFPYSDGSSKTINGVTFTVNSDGSVTANGTAVNNNALFYLNTVSSVYGQTFYLSGCPSGGGGGTYVLSCGPNNDYGQGTLVTAYGSSVLPYISIRKGYTANNLTFYPMLNEGSSTLPYMPYFPGLKNAYFKGLRSTGRNLIPFPYSDGTTAINGVTFTVNDDGSVTANGTATSQVNFYFVSNSILTFPIGTVLSLSGCPSGGNDATFFLNLISSDYTEGIVDKGNGGTFTTTKKAYYLYFRVEQGVTLTNVVIRPMLNYGSSAFPYEPYVANEISLDTAIELPAWDSINPTTGKRTVQSNTLTFDGTEKWNDYSSGNYFIFVTPLFLNVKAKTETDNVCNKLNTIYPTTGVAGCSITGKKTDGFTSFLVFFSKTAYPNLSTVDAWKAQLAAWNAAGDPLTVCYQTATSTESDISMEDRLPAYKNGSETVIQGATDNSEYGAENTLTQNYAEVRGTTETTEGGKKS